MIDLLGKFGFLSGQYCVGILGQDSLQTTQIDSSIEILVNRLGGFTSKILKV